MMTKNENSKPWSVPLAAQDVPPEGRHLQIVADEATCAAIAKLAGALSIARVEASYDISPWRGDGLRLSGEVTAVVTQNCVVTLEPIESEIAEPIELTFLPAAVNASPVTPGTATVPIEGEDPPEPLVNGTIDLGVIATEFLLLGIEPYPRKPGAVFAPPPAETEAGNPFAVLAALKKGSGEG